MANLVKRTCPDCGGELVGVLSGGALPLPATQKGDYIWQCHGKCKLNIFTAPLDKVEEYAAAFSGKKK